jgi:glycosyltransferase involved in cell wall biosynthesis
MRTLLFSDCGVPTGYGRIADEVGTRLVGRGMDVMGVSLPYDGLLPAKSNDTLLPYWVAALGGKASWQTELFKILQAVQPELVIGIQDMPYLEQLSEMPYDWSKTRLILVSPVDGVPIYPSWVRTAGRADAFFSISNYGVEAYKRAGVMNALPLIPGVNPKTFFKQTPAQRANSRALMGYGEKTFVLGTMAMNQGRKCISLMLKAFFNLVERYPGLDAKYHLDMDRESPAGWNIPALCEQHFWDINRLTFRNDVSELSLTDRFNMLDAHMVIAHREGYGLPLVEAMACGVTSIAMDYCSGTEIVGDGKGVLVPCIDYAVPSTWGGADDKFPDLGKLETDLLRLAQDISYRQATAERGHVWAQTQTWDNNFEPFWETVKALT